MGTRSTRNTTRSRGGGTPTESDRELSSRIRPTLPIVTSPEPVRALTPIPDTATTTPGNTGTSTAPRIQLPPATASPAPRSIPVPDDDVPPPTLQSQITSGGEEETSVFDWVWRLLWIGVALLFGNAVITHCFF